MVDNPTPKSKIAKLKREIEQLDAKVQECTTDRPAYQSRLITAQDLKTERPDRRKDCAKLVDTLREKIAALQMQRQSELSIFQQKKAKVTSSVKSAKAALATLQTQLAEAKKRVETEQTKAEMQLKMKTAKRKRDTQLQEREKEQLALRQDAMKRTLAESESRCLTREESRRMCWEEVWVWLAQHEEYVAEREEIEEKLADFQREFPQQDVSALIDCLRSIHSSKHLEAKKTTLMVRLENIESRLSGATKDCFLLSSSRQALVTRLTELSDPSLEASASSLEVRLQEEWDESSVLERVVLTLNSTAGFDIDEQILKTQVEIVEQRISALEKEHMLDALDLSERILEAQDECDLRQSSDSRRSVDYRGTKLKHQAEDLAKKQINRIAAVSQWRKEALGLLKTKETSMNTPVSDEVILDEIRAQLRMSAQRLPSRSPINSREHEDLLDLLDLDDDLDQLLETRYEEPPVRNIPEGLSPADRDFFERVMPLIDGAELYKKYSQGTSLKQRAFDPLLVSELPPEACGYGLRSFRLTRDLREVEVKQGLKSMIESAIPLDQIHAPLIPQTTMTILKTQKKLIKRKPQTKPLIDNLNKRYKEMKESGFVNTNSPVYEEKCRECVTYPFSIVLKQNGRLEMVARSYYTFKTWVNGLNALIKRRDELPDLCSRLRVSRRWV